jgi:hypothetical protein
MLHFIKEHKNGILGTIIFHLVLVNLFLIVRISTMKQEDTSQIIIEFPEEEQEKPKETRSIPRMDNISVDDYIEKNYSNYAAKLSKLNEAEKKLYGDYQAQGQQQEMNEEYKKKVIQEALGEEYEKYFNQEVNSSKDLPEPGKQTMKKETKENPPGEKTYYKGPTTITYELENRYDVYMPVPVYKCEGGGIVSLSIWVDPTGNVIKASIDELQENTGNDCLVEAALNAAHNSKFNAEPSAPEKQQGTLTYQFIPQ